MFMVCDVKLHLTLKVTDCRVLGENAYLFMRIKPLLGISSWKASWKLNTEMLEGECGKLLIYVIVVKSIW